MRRVTRLHDSGAARASFTRGPATARVVVGSFPRCRPSPWLQLQLLLLLLAPGLGCAKLRGRGARSAQDPQAPPPARAPVRRRCRCRRLHSFPHPPPWPRARPPCCPGGAGSILLCQAGSQPFGGAALTVLSRSTW